MQGALSARRDSERQAMGTSREEAEEKGDKKAEKKD